MEFWKWKLVMDVVQVLISSAVDLVSTKSKPGPFSLPLFYTELALVQDPVIFCKCVFLIIYLFYIFVVRVRCWRLRRSCTLCVYWSIQLNLYNWNTRGRTKIVPFMEVFQLWKLCFRTDYSNMLKLSQIFATEMSQKQQNLE